MPSNYILKCCEMLAAQKLQIAFIESATSGRMCAEFGLAPQSGDFLIGGLVCYKVPVKEHILHVPHELIEKYSAESQEVTEALAINGKEYFNSDIIVAVTGLTTPGGSETKEKPVGTIFLHIIVGNISIAHREVFNGDAEAIILEAVDKAARIITDNI